MAKLRGILADTRTLWVVAAVLVAALIGAAYVDISLIRKTESRTASSTTPSPSLASSPTSSLSPSPAPSRSSQTPSPIATPSAVNPAYPPYEVPASGPVPGGSYVGFGSVGFSCQLPVRRAYGAYTAEFVFFPGGNVVGDITSNPTVPPPAPGYTWSGDPNPDFGLSYDRAYKRWLPVKRDWVSPDGRHYAYAYPGGNGIQTVDVATGASHEIGSGLIWTLIDAESQGVYAGKLGQPGLWFVPFSGAPSQVTATGYWMALGGGAAYGDPNTNVPAAGNTIIRLDLNSRKVTNWFLADSALSSVIAFDASGRPIIRSVAQDEVTWVVPGPGQAQIIAASPNSNGIRWGTPVADTHGIWFSDSNQNEIFLYQPGVGTTGVASFGGELVGSCF